MLRAMDVLSQGMAAQRTRLDIASTNLANAETTETADGGPYRRQEVVFRAVPVEEDAESGLQGVEVSRLQNDPSPFPTKEVPGDIPGTTKTVELPNVNVVHEMTDIMTAARSFEANVTAFEALKQMLLKSMELGR